jgi:predicted amidohydrolase
VTFVAPLIAVGVIVCADLWVFADARRWARRGTPVVFRYGGFAIGTPEAWAVACLLLFVIFMPIYAVARRS